jgi:hypothetical protein
MSPAGFHPAGSKMGVAIHWQTRLDAVIAPASPSLSCGNNHTHHIRRPAYSVCKQGVRSSSLLSSTRQNTRTKITVVRPGRRGISMDCGSEIFQDQTDLNGFERD